MFRHLQEKQREARAVREAIDSYPGGLCFSTADGRPILVNKRMNRLVWQLTGRTVLNANAAWEELEKPTLSPGCERLTKPWSTRTPDELRSENWMVFRLPDGAVWRFQRQFMAEQPPVTVQIEASEITELYRLSEELYDRNLRLAGLRERQKTLLANIVQINREKELLATKMRVHDELGRCLIVTNRALAEKTAGSGAAALSKAWEDAIRDLTNIPLAGKPAEASPEAELLQVASMIGCRIDFDGVQPAGRRTQMLFYAAVREALTNAVRHAGADRLTVTTRRAGFGYHVEISDNGRVRVPSLKEGDGLGNLRRRLESEGAAMELRCEDGVVLVLELPEEETEKA